MSIPPGDLNNLTQNIVAQGAQYEGPISPSNSYYAFLSKFDVVAQDNGTLYDAFFELISMEWLNNAYVSRQNVVAPPSIAAPLLGYHLLVGSSDRLLAGLGLKDLIWVAEGSWYLLFLTTEKRSESVGGYLFPIDNDIQDRPGALGAYWINAALLLALPTFGRAGPGYVDPPEQVLVNPIEVRDGKRKAEVVEDLTLPPLKFIASPPPPEVQAVAAVPPPTITSINVNAVGQGSSNLLIAGDAVVAIVDLGYPLYFYTSSAPANLVQPVGGVGGPITPAMNPALDVVITHWDWDHWRLAKRAELATAAGSSWNWIYPQAHRGPSASALVNAIAAPATANAVPFNSPAIVRAGYTIYKCNPAGLPRAAIVNNTGLVVVVPTVNLPIVPGDVAPHYILLTGDASCGNVQPPLLPAEVWGNITGLVAVHHGSNAHGAAANLPTPVTVGATQKGRISYSYGIDRNGNHPYGFPNANAVTAYGTAVWTNANAQSTAQAGINVGAAAAGNIRMGDQTPLAAAYGNSAFAAITYALT